MDAMDLHSVVALTEDMPEMGLQRGQVGVIVESWAPGVFEVEFSDDTGVPYAMASIPQARLMRLHYEPVPNAA